MGRIRYICFPACFLGIKGNRPTIDGKKIVLEVHILNFGSDIYGKRLRVRFLKKLRNEMKFETMNDLKQQINIDMNQAKNYIKNK